MTPDECLREEMDNQCLGRRGVLRAAAGGFVLVASGLFVPADDEAEARDGVYGGRLGGRHGTNRRGVDKARRRKRARRRDDRRDDEKREATAPGAGLGPFRDTAIKVTNHTLFDLNLALDATFYFRVKTGIDSYDLPTEHERRSISRVDVTSRYAPERFRVGVLVRPAGSDHSVYADVRNLAFDFPRGFVTQGTNLNPPGGQFGQTIITEQPFLVTEDVSASLPWQDIKKVTLARTPDSADHVEFSLTIE